MTYCVLEGPKGAGKTTALRIVTRALRARGVRFQEVHPTRRGPRWHPLEVLARLPVLERDDRVRERLYAFRANHHASRAKGGAAPLTLGDRSVLTSIVTRWERASRDGVDAHVRSVRALEHRVPLPDHVFYLDVPLELLLQRVAERRPRRRYGRDHESRAHLEKVTRAYAALRSCPPPALARVRWHTVDARQPAGVVARTIVNHIADLVES